MKLKKKERKKENALIDEIFETKKEIGMIKAKVSRVFEMVRIIHKTNVFKVTFDLRKNESRDEVLIAIIPAENSKAYHIHSPLSSFVFCFLHAKARITETILRHQIKSYYSKSKNKQQSLKKFENTLIELTGNNNIKIMIPRNVEDETKFGNVIGLTGNMIDRIIIGGEELSKLTHDQSNIERIKNIWDNWKWICKFIKKKGKSTKK